MMIDQLASNAGNTPKEWTDRLNTWGSQVLDFIKSYRYVSVPFHSKKFSLIDCMLVLPCSKECAWISTLQETSAGHGASSRRYRLFDTSQAVW